MPRGSRPKPPDRAEAAPPSPAAAPARRDVLSRATTIDAVARAAGVSAMTVSRALRGQENVAAKTRERVLRVVEEMGYVRNEIAGSLASSTSSQVAVIVPTLRTIVFTEVLAGVADALAETGLQPVIGVTEYDLAREADLVRAMLAWRPAGVIVANSRHHEDTVRLLRRAGAPVVEVMELIETPIDMCVGLDQRAAGAAMSAHLIAKGYRRFGYLGADHRLDAAAGRRFEGFAESVRAGGGAIEAVLTAPEPSGIGLGRRNLGELLARAPQIDAVYFSNDAVAAGALMHCLAEGIDVPGRLALASFSGLEIAEAMPIPITTVRSPRYEMGATAARRIVERRSGLAPARITDAGFMLVPGASA